MSEKISNERLDELIADKLIAIDYANGNDLKDTAAIEADELSALRELRALRDPKWKLVPVEPTQAMLDAACWSRVYKEDDDDKEPREMNSYATYRAMLSAAPSVTIEGSEIRA